MLAARKPLSGTDQVDLLRNHHRILMAARPDKRRSELKEADNYAGGYRFVEPDLLIGTLKRGFEIFSKVTDPLHRAAAVMFLITECHPFDDGNGRVAASSPTPSSPPPARSAWSIPTVYRNNYLAGLTAVSNQAGCGEAPLSVLRFAQRWVAAVDWSGFKTADTGIRAANGYTDPGLAESTGQRLRIPGR
ncbi:Fic family protein [Streptomyces sp. NPDC001089]